MILTAYAIIAIALMISKCIGFVQAIKGEHPRSDELRDKLDQVEGIWSVKFIVLSGFVAAFIHSLFWIYFVPRGFYRRKSNV